MKIVDDWFGVYSRNGELEAVESTKGMAESSAYTLSLNTKGIPQHVKTVEPILIIRGDAATAVETLMAFAEKGIDWGAVANGVKRRLNDDKQAADKATGDALLAAKAMAADPANKVTDL